MTIHIINGPNLNLLGRREPHIYGTRTFEAYLEELRTEWPDVDLKYFQSNHEGALIDYLHTIMESGADGIIINAGGLTHTSVALADALAAINIRTIEVHISNIHAREAYRHHSYIAARAVGSIVGLGLEGYRLAVSWFLQNKK
jgi:3-dehydroquinate dehydratase II